MECSLGELEWWTGYSHFQDHQTERSYQEKVCVLSFKVLILLSIYKRFPWPALGVPILTIQLDLCHLLDGFVHAPGFLGQNTGVISRIWWSKLMLHLAIADSSAWYSQTWCSPIGFNGTVTLSSRPSIFKVRPTIMGQMKLEIFLGEISPVLLCLHSTSLPFLLAWIGLHLPFPPTKHVHLHAFHSQTLYLLLYNSLAS